MTDQELLALCIFSEAAGETLEGKQAVAHVILNRMRTHYQSDGTVLGTVLHPSAFSGFWYAFGAGGYTRVAHTLDEAQARAALMLASAEHTAVWPLCVMVATQALDGDLPAEPDLEHAVLYVNPAISKPIWAEPDKLLCTVGHHQFYAA